MKENINVLNDLVIDLTVEDNPFNLDMNSLFQMAARINPNRSFLFISKVLGKHLSVNPNIPKVSGHLLANLLNKKENGEYFSNVNCLTNAIEGNIDEKQLERELFKSTQLNQKTVFFGFAETATGLGHAVASAFQDSLYIHTTRDVYSDTKPVFTFEEEHSHATSHFCYLDSDDEILNAEHLVLIDDEMTTGKTGINLVKALNDKYPNKKYSILTLLDWRTKAYEERYKKLSEELDLDISVIALVSGSIEVVNDCKFTNDEKQDIRIDYDLENDISINIISFEQYNLKEHTGKFGASFVKTSEIEEIAKEIGKSLSASLSKGRTLCIGSGELIYVPSRIASYIGNVEFKSSTRSPIYLSEKDKYPIKDKMCYTTDFGVKKHIYNIDGLYDEIVMFFDSVPSTRLINELSTNFASKGVTGFKIIII